MPQSSSSQRVRKDYAANFDRMAIAGKAVSEALDRVAEMIGPGVSTRELDQVVVDFSRENGCIPAPLNYRGFPGAICTSINHVVCHGIPGQRALREGDVVNVDVTLIVDGWHADASRMFPIGAISRRAEILLEVTETCLQRGIDVVGPGSTTGDIGHAIQAFAEGHRFSVVRDFCGHGVGRMFHEEPQIFHFGFPGSGTVLKEGMIFTIEPMINGGGRDVKVLQDGWTAVTRDKSLSAQVEHTIGVTDCGAVIFTDPKRSWC